MRYKYGGEGGIRTLDTVLSVYPLSKASAFGRLGHLSVEMTFNASFRGFF